MHLPRFGDILIWIDCRKIVVKVSIFGIEIHIWIGSAHRESLRKVSWRTRKNLETGIVTLISYHHYLKIVGNNKL